MKEIETNLSEREREREMGMNSGELKQLKGQGS